MGIAQISFLLVNLCNHFPDLSVAIAVSMQMLGDPLVIMIEEIQDPYEITGIAHIHGIGNGGSGGPWTKSAGEQIGGYHIIEVIDRKEGVYRKSHLPGYQSCRHVPVVSAGNREKGFASRIKLSPCSEIIEGLGEEPGQVYGVG